MMISIKKFMGDSPSSFCLSRLVQVLTILLIFMGCSGNNNSLINYHLEKKTKIDKQKKEKQTFQIYSLKKLIAFDSKIEKISISSDESSIFVVTRKYQPKINDKLFFHISKLNIENMSIELLDKIPLAYYVYSNTLSFFNNKLSYVTNKWHPNKFPIPIFRTIDLAKKTQKIRDIRLFKTKIKAFKESNEFHLSVAIDSIHNIYLWNNEHSELLWKRKLSASYFNNRTEYFIDFSFDNKTMIVSSNFDNKIIVLEVNSGKILKTINTKQVKLTAISIFKNKNKVLFSTKNKNLMLYDLGENRLIRSIKTQNYLEKLLVSKNNKCLIAINSVGEILIFSLNNLLLLLSFQANEGWVTNIELSKSNTFGISYGPKNIIYKWNIPKICHY